MWAGLTALLISAAAAWGQSPPQKRDKLTPDLTEILSHMNKAAENLRTISANLEYTKVTVLVDDKLVQSGQLFYRKSKGTDILIDFKKPEAKTIAFRKNRGEIYNPKINQIDEYNLEGRRGLVEQFLLLGFGTETERIKKDYDLRFLKEEDLQGDITVVLDLTPLSETTRAQLTHIQLWVSEESWLPVQQKFFQPGGDYLLARYTNVKVNRPLSNAAFIIRAPKDVKRVSVN
ncbi:MAG: outer membrane lipoprotein carrier protein LolA [Acidobacteria bacterium]|nr:outer membrane lipoprotein carrier protein LolA [Acidobacteriota bacterium]